MNGWWPSYVTSIVPGGWSIAVEMNFYLLVPFLFKYIKNLTIAIIFLVLSFFTFNFVSDFMVFAVSQYFPSNQQYLVTDWAYTISLPINMYAFSVGIFLFFLYKKDIKINDTIAYCMFYISVAILVGLLFLDIPRWVIIFSMMLFMFFSSKVKSEIITGKIIRYIGKISFSLYFIHFYVYEWIKRWKLFPREDADLLQILMAASLCLFISSLIATLTHKFIEQKSIDIGKNLIKKLEKRNATSQKVTA